MMKNNNKFYKLDFNEVAASLRGKEMQILRDLLPLGRVYCNEYIALNPRRADNNFGNFKINIRSWFWADFAAYNVKGKGIISLYAYIHDISYSDAVKALAKFYGGVYEK